MGFIMENPVLWGIIFVVLLITIIVVTSIVVSKHRKKEVEEIEKMFPSGNMTSEDIKVSVERVRRATKEREHKKKRIHRERPRGTHPDENKEIFRREKDTASKQDSASSKENKPKEEAASVTTQAKTTNKSKQADLDTVPEEETEQPSAKEFSRKSGKILKSDLLSTTRNRHKPEEKGDYKRSRGHSLLQQTVGIEKEEKSEDLAVKQKTHKFSPKLQSEQTGKEMQEKEAQGTTDKAISRRLFKRSLLKPDKEATKDSDKLPKASLIDTHMFSGQEEEKQDETETNLPPRQKRVNKKSFFSKRK